MVLWTSTLRRCRSLGTSCLPAAFAAFTTAPQQQFLSMMCDDQRRCSSSSTATSVAQPTTSVYDRYPEETKPPALSRLFPDIVDYEDMQKHDGMGV